MRAEAAGCKTPTKPTFASDHPLLRNAAGRSVDRRVTLVALPSDARRRGRFDSAPPYATTRSYPPTSYPKFAPNHRSASPTVHPLRAA